MQMIWIDSLDFGDVVEVAIRGDDLFDSIVDHCGGVDCIPRGDGGNLFHQLQGSICLSKGYRKDIYTELNCGKIGHFGNFRLSQGKITVENFLEDFRADDGANISRLDFLQDSFAGLL